MDNTPINSKFQHSSRATHRHLPVFQVRGGGGVENLNRKCLVFPVECKRYIMRYGDVKESSSIYRVNDSDGNVYKV